MKKKHNLSYAEQLQLKKQAEIAEAMQQGMTFGGCLYAVALNNLFGFGADRLLKLEKEAQRLMDEEFGRDIELASYRMIHRMEQIRGKDWGKEDGQL